jgi:hypothetical protein
VAADSITLLRSFCTRVTFFHIPSLKLPAIKSERDRKLWCFEAPGVEPVFLDQEHAIDYATGRACFRSGEIRILDSSGAATRIIPFTEMDRRL